MSWLEELDRLEQNIEPDWEVEEPNEDDDDDDEWWVMADDWGVVLTARNKRHAEFAVILRNHARELIDAKKNYQKRYDELRNLYILLRQAEWGDEGFCRICGGESAWGGHNSECKLGKVLPRYGPKLA